MYDPIISYIGKAIAHCLLVMTEMCSKALDEQKIPGAILTDLSKALFKP